MRLYNHLFAEEFPEDLPEGVDYKASLNPESVERLSGCYVEPSLAGVSVGARFQFERQGYFCVDADSTAEALVFNRTVGLRDTWAKFAKQQARG